MANYKLSTGNLNIKIKKSTDDYIFLELHFNGQEKQLKQITKDSFKGLNEWVKENYILIKKIN